MIDGEDCYRVELTSLAGDVSVEYFSIDSGYLVRRISKLAAPAGKFQITEDFDEYRTVGDRTAWHTSIKHLPGGVDVVTKLERVHLNQPIDDSIFKVPSLADCSTGRGV